VVSPSVFIQGLILLGPVTHAGSVRMRSKSPGCQRLQLDAIGTAPLQLGNQDPTVCQVEGAEAMNRIWSS